MTSQYANESRWRARLAPYVLLTGLLGLSLSFVWGVPIVWSIPVGLLSGALVFLFHMRKWLTGQERFQGAAMAAAFVPMFVFFAFKPPFLQMLQYVSIVMTAYSGCIVLLRRKILALSQT
jgi:hypothetical protein